MSQLSRKQIACIASIDAKHDEVAILQLAGTHGWPIHFFSKEQLAQVDVPNPSETVLRYMGTPSVSEAAAILAGRTKSCNLLLEKHRLRGADGKNATISIAKMEG